jgi:AcrR family transcriptional regulator
MPADPSPASDPVGKSSKGRRAQQRAETRERLYQAALREFRDVGFADAQVDRIARAAGVARGTFYFHFPSKDDVLLELARRNGARVARRLAALGETKPGLRELLLRMNDAMLDENGRVGEAGLLGDMLALYMRRPFDLESVDSPDTASMAGALSRRLRELADRGELNTRLPPERLAIMILSSLFGVYTRLRPGEDQRRTCESLIDLLVKGLQADR